MYECVYVCSTFLYVCMYVCVYVCSTFLYVCMYVCVYVCMCVCTCMYVYIHTDRQTDRHTHTHVYKRECIHIDTPNERTRSIHPVKQGAVVQQRTHSKERTLSNERTRCTHTSQTRRCCASTPSRRISMTQTSSSARRRSACSPGNVWLTCG